MTAMWLCRAPVSSLILRMLGQDQGGSASPARVRVQGTGQMRVPSNKDRSRGRAGSSGSRCPMVLADCECVGAFVDDRRCLKEGAGDCC